ncbi:hypothetical protein O6H91_07G005400 [Diphasiastrum complanatum]|uniref:Uncharacterized protein n=1 Tax=Diphasiastrum complanatum TaxID=34168 RepID=A0ACC2D291_DIPCM|nr:hypothetical protein O6H91_07G005400 [Diphasiastrum complanatum]
MASNGTKMANGFNATQKRILVTGGAGYIGSHTVLQLLEEGYKVVIVDNLNNSVEEAVKRVVGLAGKNGNNLRFCLVDLCDKDALDKVFSSSRFDAVIHFAGLKAVGASVANPLLYYYNNLVGTLNLFEVMKTYSCKKLVFSSSATVYGQPKSVPCTEDFPREAVNPYGQTKQVAVGRRSELTVYGNDYPTKDGTGVRDYVHVMDLADGHLAALRKLFNSSDTGCAAYNLGTGKGVSVLEMIEAFERASGKKIPYRLAARRPGDCAEVYASTQKAERELNWKAKYGVEEMCRDQWNWASQNPWGYNAPRADSNGTANHGCGSMLGNGRA